MPTQAEKGLNGLTSRQEAVAVALASGASLDQAAKASGAGVSTIKTWVATCPALTRRVGELRAEMTSAAVGELVAALSGAVSTMRETCNDPDLPPAVRLRAAEAIVANAMELRDSAELESRIAALESERGNT